VRPFTRESSVGKLVYERTLHIVRCTGHLCSVKFQLPCNTHLRLVFVEVILRFLFLKGLATELWCSQERDAPAVFTFLSLAMDST